MGGVLLVRTVYNRCRKGVDAGLEGALRSPWVDGVGCIVELCAHENKADHCGVGHIAVCRWDEGRYAEHI